MAARPKSATWEGEEEGGKEGDFRSKGGGEGGGDIGHTLSWKLESRRRFSGLMSRW